MTESREVQGGEPDDTGSEKGAAHEEGGVRAPGRQWGIQDSGQ